MGMRRAYPQFMRAIISSEAANGAAFLIILMATAVIFLFGSGSDPTLKIAPVDWDEQTLCRAGLSGVSNSGETFVARVISGLEGDAVCDRLSQAPALRNHYDEIEVRWEPHAVDAERAIAQGDADLMLLRPNAQGVASDFLTALYTEVGHYPGYEVFLISDNRQPALTAESLTALAIGLHAEKESRSGYIVPMALFHELGIAVDELDIRYYPGHAELRRALASGEIDAISSYWSERDQARFPDWHTLEIDQVSEGLNWYIGKTAHKTLKVRCAILRVLDGLAAERTRGYFAELRIREEAYEPCGQE